jgi:DNA-directed RNA polymerase specialized sigma24 family protein
LSPDDPETSDDESSDQSPELGLPVADDRLSEVSPPRLYGDPGHDGMPRNTRSSSRFPTTRRSWITRMLARGPEGEQEVARFVMSAYLLPLKSYARSLPGWGELDHEDAVHDFLANKVNVPDYFVGWSKSGRPLRRWLVNGFHFRLKDRRRKATTDRQRTEAAAPELLSEIDDARFAEFERTWAQDLIRRAVERAATECEARGLGDHWEVFKRHHIDGLTYRELVGPYRLPPRRLARMSRTAADRLRVVIQELLERDGVGPDDVAAEIARLLELVR